MIVERYFAVDVQKPLKVQGMTDMLVAGDRNAHRFHATLTKHGEPVEAVGNVTAYYLRPDGRTVVLRGETAGNDVSVLLPAGCYEVPGWAQLLVKLTSGESVTTVLALDTQVLISGTGELVDPEHVVPSLDELLEKIAAMEAATAEARAVIANAVVGEPVALTADNYTQYFTNANNAPYNKIFVLAANFTSSQIANLPISRASGTLFTFGGRADSINGRVQLFLTSANEYYFREAFSSHWRDWKHVVDDGSMAQAVADRARIDGMFKVFLRVGVIGDSLASGEAYSLDNGESGGTLVDYYEHSWPQYMARLSGNVYYNFSSGGTTAESWLVKHAGEAFDGRHDCQAYVVGLGLNDANHDVPIADFTRDYTTIIDRCMAQVDGCHVFVVTIPRSQDKYAAYNAAIRSMADGVRVHLIDLAAEQMDEYTSGWISEQVRSGHYNALAYSWMAGVMARAISSYMDAHKAAFAKVELVKIDGAPAGSLEEKLEHATATTTANVENLKAAAEDNLYKVQVDDTTAYSKDVPAGSLPFASLEMVGGKTLVWNQMVATASITKTINVTEDVDNNKWDPNNTLWDVNFGGKVGHNVFFMFVSNDDKLTLHNGINNASLAGNVVTITNEQLYSGGSLKAYAYLKAGLKAGSYSASCMMFDLTAMFGAGNELSAEQFRAMFPADYYPYSEPTLMSFGADQVVSRGRNLWDIDKYVVKTSVITKKEDDSLIIGSAAYLENYNVFNFPESNKKYSVSFDYEVLDSTSNSATLRYRFVRPNNYFTAAGAIDAGVVGKKGHKVCVSEAGMIGFSFGGWGYGGSIKITNMQITATDAPIPYRKPVIQVLPMSSLVQKYFPDGMKSAGTVHDSIEVDDDGKWWAVQRVGSAHYDGSEAWQLNSSYPTKRFYMRPNPQIDGKLYFNGGYSQSYPRATILSNWGTYSSADAVYKGIANAPAYNTWHDNDNDDALVVALTMNGNETLADFKAYLQDHPLDLNFMLKNEIRTEITDPINLMLPVEAGGSLTFTNDQGDDYRVELPNRERLYIKSDVACEVEQIKRDIDALWAVIGGRE